MSRKFEQLRRAFQRLNYSYFEGFNQAADFLFVCEGSSIAFGFLRGSVYYSWVRKREDVLKGRFQKVHRSVRLYHSVGIMILRDESF